VQDSAEEVLQHWTDSGNEVKMRGHNHVIVSYENGSGLMEELESLKERLSIVEQNNSILNQNVSTLNQDNSILNQEVNKLNKKAGAGDRIRWRLANTMLRDHPDIGIPYNLRADPKIVRLGNITAHDADADVRFLKAVDNFLNSYI